MRPDQDSSVKAVRPIAAIAQVSTSGTSIRMASNIRNISKCNASCTRVINTCTHLKICILQCVFYNMHSTMRLHPDVHMSSSEACRTADSRQIRRAALFLSVHVSPVSFSALFLLLHICTVSSIALFLLLHACPVSFIALFILHLCNDFFISILHCFPHSHFLHCVKPCNLCGL